jgi:hypothetical protein
MGIQAATDTVAFCAYLDQVLLPELRRSKPDAVLVMDKLGAHKSGAVRTLLDGAGFAYHYLPPYSPDLGPIAVLTAMGTHQPDRARLGQGEGLVTQGRGTDLEGLHTALGPALAAITKGDARGFFRHAGYACSN